MRSTRSREATPLPGQGGINAKILRKLIALKAALVKSEINTFAKSILPILLDVQSAVKVSLLGAFGKADGNVLQKAQLSTLLNEIGGAIQAAGKSMSAEMASALPDIGSQWAAATQNILTDAIPSLGGSIFSPVNAEEIENVATKFGTGFANWAEDAWGPGSFEVAKKALAQSVALGEDAAEAAARMAKATGVSTNAAAQAVRTAIHANAADLREQYLAENSDVFDSRMYVATLDFRTCPVCGPDDGKTWSIDDPTAPSIPRHRSCRCDWVPVVKDWSDTGLPDDWLEPGTRASMDGEVPATMTYQDWLAAQEAAEGAAWMRGFLGERRLEKWVAAIDRDSFSFGDDVARWRTEAETAARTAWKKNRIALESVG